METAGNSVQRVLYLSFVLFCCFYGSHSVDEVSYKVDEETFRGKFIGNIGESIDINKLLSNEELKTVSYKFASQSDPHVGLFSLNDRTGDLSTAQIINREDVCSFTSTCVLDINFVVLSLKGFLRKVKAQIVINDINDNAPYFPEDEIALRVSEQSKPLSKFSIKGAIDRDSGKNSVQSYELLPTNGTFDIEIPTTIQSGSEINLVLRDVLDRERTATYQLHLIVKDGGEPQRSGSVSIRIDVGDVNDNAPVFNQPSYDVSIDEDIALNTPILTLVASDADVGENANIRYRLAQRQSEHVQGGFAVNEISGEVFVVGALDFIPGVQYKLYVEAFDNGSPPKEAQALVNIAVKDAGNNPPEIKVKLLSRESYGEVSEFDKAGGTIAIIQVLDTDQGSNGIVNCDVPSHKFELKEIDFNEYRLTATEVLDRESQDEYSVTIKCIDFGSPPLTSYISVRVKVKDENDNPPVFSRNIFTGTIPENNSIGAYILQVTASDADIGTNARVTYALYPGGGDDFAVDRSSGIVTAKTVFDREGKRSKEFNSVYTFRVLAVDSGESPNTATATVQVTIEDINDNRPLFASPEITFVVMENQQIHTKVGAVHVSDLDEGYNAVISLTLASLSVESPPFSVSDDGSVRTTEVLDREANDKYVMDVIATDNGGLSSKAKITIFVLDENDNDPVILYPSDKNRTLRIPYTSESRDVIATIDAYDFDEGLDGQLEYSLEGGNASHLVQINKNTGVLYLSRKLEDKDVGRYILHVSVWDMGNPPRTNYATFVLQVVNEDDGESRLNILLAVVIGSVTVALAIAIISTILIIRRLDRQRRLRKEVEKAHPHAGYNMNMMSKDSMDSLATNMSDKKAKKDGQYSLNNELQHNTNAPDITLSHGSNLPKVNNQGTDAERESRPRSPPDGHMTQLSDSLDENRMASLKYHQMVYPLGRGVLGSHSSSTDEHGREFREGMKRPDDVHSNSSGETTASDSGRGGSEEDVTSHNDTIQDDNLSPSIKSQTGLFLNIEVKNQNNSTSRHSWTPRGANASPGGSDNSYREEPVSNSSFQNSNHLRSANGYPSRSASARTRSLSPQDWEQNQNYRQPHSSLRQANSFSPRYSGSNVPQRQVHFQLPSDGRRGNYTPMTTFASPMQRVDERGDMMNDSVTTLDDDNTTTSGSYTIDSEDYGKINLHHRPADIVL